MGFLNPGALIFASLYAILVLLHLWERYRSRVEVPSLLLWKTVREDAVQAQRFRPDLLFLLQLLLLAALIFGLAKPYLSDGQAPEMARRHVFVLDVSASMQAREARTTRFQAAREQLRSRLEALPSSDEVMLITAAARPEVVADFTRDHAAVGRLLDTLEPTDTGTELELALALATGARQRTDAITDIQVFSDLPPSRLPQHWRDRATFVQFGETDANLAITGLQMFQSRFQGPQSAQAYIVVQNFSHREESSTLTVRVDDTVMSRSEFTVPERDMRAFFASDFPGPGRIAAEIDADALPADNLALGWVRPLLTTRILLVSAAGPLVDELDTIARATPGLQLTTVPPESYKPEASADVVIFHRFVPKAEPATAALYVYPEPGNGLLPVASEMRDVEVLDWNDRHPAVGSLRPLATLPIRRARAILPAPWQQPLLISRTLEREFSLAFAGVRHGRRVACIAFDLEGERLLIGDNVNFLMFFLSLLSWLAPDMDEILTVATGTVVPLTGLPPVPVTAIGPRGRHIELSDGGTTSLEPLDVGEYRISADGVTRRVYANFFDPIESDIGRAGKEGVVVRKPPPSARTPAVSPARGAEFGWWLFAAAAGLFMTEWVVSVRRR